MKIISKEYIGKQKTFDLFLESEPHNFVLENNTVCSNSHSISYSFLTYQTAWLKYYYPKEFFCVLLSLENDNDKLLTYISNAKQNGIEVLRPSVKYSKKDFYIVDEKSIAYGLNSIKGITDKTINIITKNTFNNILDFFKVASQNKFNKKILESLILSGCLDYLYENRKELIEKHEFIISQFSKGIFKYLESFEQKHIDQVLTGGIKDFTIQEKIALEKEYLPVNFTSFDFESYNIRLYMYPYGYSEFVSNTEINEIQIVVFVNSITSRSIKKGTRVFELYDYECFDKYNNFFKVSRFKNKTEDSNDHIETYTQKVCLIELVKSKGFINLKDIAIINKKNNINNIEDDSNISVYYASVDVSRNTFSYISLKNYFNLLKDMENVYTVNNNNNNNNNKKKDYTIFKITVSYKNLILIENTYVIDYLTKDILSKLNKYEFVMLEHII